MLVAADFCFLLGRFVKVDYESLLRVLNEHCRGKVINSEDKSLDAFIESQFPNNYRKFRRYAFNKQLTKFDKQLLKNFAISVEPEFLAVKMDELLYYLALKDGLTADFCSFFIIG